MDFLLNTAGDLDLTGNTLNMTADRGTSIAQHIRVRLRFLLGEWFLDQRLGIPYFERILVKNPDLGAVSAILQEAILETAGVISLQRFDLTLNNSTRSLTVTASVLTDTTDAPLDFLDAINISEGI